VHVIYLLRGILRMVRIVYEMYRGIYVLLKGDKKKSSGSKKNLTRKIIFADHFIISPDVLNEIGIWTKTNQVPSPL